MINRIQVDKEINSSRKHEYFRCLVISLIGIFVPLSLWLVNHNRIESSIMRGFATVMMILVTTTSFLYGLIKTSITLKRMMHYRKVLTLYSSIDELTHVPQTAIVTTCLRIDTGQFGFQKINYYFWIDDTELVFFPTRPIFANSKAYKIVQAVRLNSVMVRHYSLIGNEYDDGIKSVQENLDSIEQLSYHSSTEKPVFRDTRATLISYAFGEQTIFLAFDKRLYDRMKTLIPDKDKSSIEAIEKLVESSLLEKALDSINEASVVVIKESIVSLETAVSADEASVVAIKESSVSQEMVSLPKQTPVVMKKKSSVSKKPNIEVKTPVVAKKKSNVSKKQKTKAKTSNIKKTNA